MGREQYKQQQIVDEMVGLTEETWNVMKLQKELPLKGCMKKGSARFRDLIPAGLAKTFMPMPMRNVSIGMRGAT